MKRAARLIISLFWIVLPPLTAARAETVADFYRGKTIELAIAGAPAGGYDVAARTLAKHYSRHIPGNPTVIVKNMPGAAGLVVANYLYNVAKRDGTVIGMPTSNVPLEPRLKLLSPDGSNVKFDLGIPAISYSHASFFAAFKALGIKEPIKGHGRLLAALADAAA